MVFKKKSLTELKKEIAEQKRKISGEDISSKELSERSKLNKELFELRNRKLIIKGRFSSPFYIHNGIHNNSKTSRWRKTGKENKWRKR